MSEMQVETVRPGGTSRAGLSHSRAMLSEQLYRLAGDVSRLAPSHRNPESFFESKSEIAEELRRIADEVEAPRSRERVRA